MSLMQTITGMLTSQLLGTVAGKLGEDEGAVSKGLGALVPTILAGMVGKAGTPAGLDSLFGMLNKSDNAGFLNDLGGLVGSGNLAHGDPKDAAGNLIGSLFGDKTGGILNAVMSMAGLRNRDSAGGLLSLAGPLIMGVLGKEIIGKGLNPAGLLNLLMGEKDKIHAAVPGPIASLIGLPAVAHAAPPVTTHTTTRAPAAAVATPAYDGDRKGGNWLMWLLPLAALGLLSWVILGRGNKTDDVVASTPVAAPEVVVPVETDLPTIDVDPATIIVPGLDMTTFGEGTVERSLVGFINSDREPCTVEGCWFTLDRVTFDTAKSTIDMGRSTDQLTNLKLIMDAYPTLKLKFGGYTDNVGNEASNLKLSTDRAQAITVALAGMGVAADRMRFEGYGPQFPVADNATEEGRAQNRRIDVRVDAR